MPIDFSSLGLGGIFSKVVSGVASSFGPQIRTTDPYANTLIQWSAQVQGHAAGRWKGVADAGYTCVVKARAGGMATCDNPAAGLCAFCKQSVCVLHAAVAPNGALACIVCLNKTLEAHATVPGPAGKGFGHNATDEGPAAAPPPPRGPEPPSAIRKRHLKTMGLAPGVTMATVNRTLRAFSKKNHPDKGGDRETYKRWTEAHAWLVANGVDDDHG